MIQLEWIFLQHVTKGTGHTFAGAEKLIWEIFLPCLFFRKSKSLLSIVRTLSRMPVKKSGLGIQDPVTFSNNKLLSYLRASSNLIGSVTVASGFSTSDCLLGIREEKYDRKKIRDDANYAKLKELVKYL